MAGNDSTLQDEDGDYSDWIELLDTRDTDVNLAGWVLTHSAGDLTK